MNPPSTRRRLDEINLIPNLGTSDLTSSLVSHMKPSSDPQQRSRQIKQKPYPSSTTSLPSLPAISSKQVPRAKPSGGISGTEAVSTFDESEKTLVAITPPNTHIAGRTSSLREVPDATVYSSASDTPLVPGYYPPDTVNATDIDTRLAALITHLCSPSGLNFPTWSCIEEFVDNNIDWIFPACDLLVVIMTLDLLSQIFWDPLVTCFAALFHFVLFGARLVFYKHFSLQARAGKKKDRYSHSDALAAPGSADRPRDAQGRIIRRLGTSPVDAKEAWDAQAIADWESRRRPRVTSSSSTSQEVVEGEIIRGKHALLPVSLIVA